MDHRKPTSEASLPAQIAPSSQSNSSALSSPGPGRASTCALRKKNDPQIQIDLTTRPLCLTFSKHSQIYLSIELSRGHTVVGLSRQRKKNVEALYHLFVVVMPKLWLAIFFGYNGATFNGMQFQVESHVNTIEGLLVEKLHSAELLPTNNFSQLQKNQRWSRAARTDKGVHAIVNGISCLFSLANDYLLQDKTLNKERLHAQLKELFQGSQIVYHCFKRVTNRFQIRHMVRSRHYSYICPKIMFIGPQQEAKKEAEQQTNVLKTGWSVEEEQEIMKKLNECCNLYIGTHNFHNYSKNLKAKDAQAQRYVIKFTVRVVNENYFCFDIIGQSFIYHQIRKIIGGIIMVMSNGYPANFINNTFFRNQISMPIAPAQGLYLSDLNFGHYNRKNDIPEQLEFQGLDSLTALKGDIQQYITDLDGDIWVRWLKELKESIHHGIQLKQDNNQQIVNDQ